MNGAWTSNCLSTFYNIFIRSRSIRSIRTDIVVVEHRRQLKRRVMTAAQPGAGINWNNQFSATDVPWLATTGDIHVDRRHCYLISWFRTSCGPPMASVFGTRPCRRTAHRARPLSGIPRAPASNNWWPMRSWCAPGGKPVVASWDRPFFYVSDPNTYPSSYGPWATRTICRGLVARLCLVEPELSGRNH